MGLKVGLEAKFGSGQGSWWRFGALREGSGNPPGGVREPSGGGLGTPSGGVFRGIMTQNGVRMTPPGGGPGDPWEGSGRPLGGVREPLLGGVLGGWIDFRVPETPPEGTFYTISPLREGCVPPLYV